ncbi:invasion associated locus B family protein [Xanthobacteraceae bacterium A53D]
MQTFSIVSRVALQAGVLGLLTLAAPAMAQTARPAAPAAAPAESSEPSTTTAAFGDWVLRCQRVTIADKPARICEVAQSMQVQGQEQPVAQVAIGRLEKANPLRITVALPPAISFPSSVQLFTSGDKPTADLAWSRCLPGGCFAEVTLNDDLVKRLRAATEQGRLTFKDAAGRDVALPLSFKGLGPALDALAKQS